MNPFPVRCPANQLLFRPTQKQDFRRNTCPDIYNSECSIPGKDAGIAYKLFANSNPDPNHSLLFWVCLPEFLLQYLRLFARIRYFVVTGFCKGPSTRRIRRPETNSVQLIELVGWTLTTVFSSLKRRDNADNEWHTGSKHTGVFEQLGSGSHSKGESPSISLGDWRWSWCSTLGGLLDNQR